MLPWMTSKVMCNGIGFGRMTIPKGFAQFKVVVFFTDAYMLLNVVCTDGFPRCNNQAEFVDLIVERTQIGTHTLRQHRSGLKINRSLLLAHTLLNPSG